MILIPLYIVNLVCAWFQCEAGTKPPFIFTSNKNTKDLIKKLPIPIPKLPVSMLFLSPRERGGRKLDPDRPLVYTRLGTLEGYEGRSANGRRIFSFTGVPYGEPPVGNLRFRDPIPRRPWKGIRKATEKSPFCIQSSGMTLGMLRGQEDCLYLDIHTPHIPDGSKREGLPVILWIPAGANFYGRSRTYGPMYLLNEDVILVPINMRFGALGFLSTGDEACPGNWGLKDMSLAVKWVYDNIEGFGGDRNRIMVGGLSSGAYSAHLLLFTKLPIRKYVTGIFSMSGNAMTNHGFDAKGRVQEASNMIAKTFNCPTAKAGRSWEMVECLRKINPYKLAAGSMTIYKSVPPLSKMLSPTLEPHVPGAFISDLPEVLYEKGEVNRIPLIMSRAEDEVGFTMQRMRFTLMQILQFNWYDWMPKLCQLGYRSSGGSPVSYEESQINLMKINAFYFNKTKPPIFIKHKDYLRFVELIDDMMYNAGLWKSIELHHKIAPTYGYINKQRMFYMKPIVETMQRAFMTDVGASHAMDYFLFFNNSQIFPLLPPGSDYERASKNLLNMIVNFAKYGTPYYRTQDGNLLSLWKPIEDMKNPLMLEIGLVDNISMVRDPLPGTRRLQIWDEVRF